MQEAQTLAKRGQGDHIGRMIERLHCQVFDDLLQKMAHYDQIFAETSSSLSKKCQFFSPNILVKIFLKSKHRSQL
jgi:hypothetical protein